MSNSSGSSGGGLGLASELTIVFVILKLTNNIDWSWWWVFSPLWISALPIVLFRVVATIFMSGPSFGRK